MNTYQGLTAAVTAFAGQEGNPEFTQQVGTFIALGEADIYRKLRHDRMLKSIPVGTAPPYLIPDDFLEAAAVDHGYDVCEYAPPDIVRDIEATTDAPTLWSLFGSELVFDGTPTDVTILIYYAKPPELIAAVNPLFVQNSDLFLYAALSHAMIFLRDEARQAVWAGLFQTKLAELIGSAWDARVPKRQPLTTRTR